MKRRIILMFCVLLLASAVQAAEPFGGKRNYMTFSLGGYWPSGDLEVDSGRDETLNLGSIVVQYALHGCCTDAHVKAHAHTFRA